MWKILSFVILVVIFVLATKWIVNAVNLYDACVVAASNRLPEVKNAQNKLTKCIVNKQIVLDLQKCSSNAESKTHLPLAVVSTVFSVLGKGDAPPYSAIKLQNDSCSAFPDTLIPNPK